VRYLLAAAAAFVALSGAQAAELAWRQERGALIGLPSDHVDAWIGAAPTLLLAVGLAAAVQRLLQRWLAPPTVGLMLAMLVDAGLRVLLAEAWLGAAADADAAPFWGAGLVYAGVLPTLAAAGVAWGTARAGRLRRPPVAASLATAAILATTLAVPSSRADDDRPNLLLITIDTWRYDHLSAHPDAVADDLTPHLDRLAKRGWLFTEARAHAPITVPSHASMLSGQGPWEHGMTGNGSRVPAEAPWLPRTLQQAGYATAAVVSGAVIRGERGFSRGFDRFHDDLVEPAGVHDLVALRLGRRLRGEDDPKVFRAEAPRALRRAQAWLARQDRPWFLWVHLYDVHSPHSADADPRDGDPLAELPDPCAYRDHPAPAPAALGVPQLLGSAARERRCRPTGNLATRLQTYRAEVRRADDAVGHLLHGLRKTGALARTAVIATADHGESLTEHGMRMSHQHSAYEPVLRVPLIVAPPGSTQGRRVDTLVEHRDLPATALAMLGLSSTSGRSWLQGGRPRTGPVASVTAFLGGVKPGRSDDPGFPAVRVAVRDRSTAVVWSRDHATEWYDLAADRHQLLDRSAEQGAPPEFVAAARAIAASVGAARRDEELDDDELEALRALGYVD
jgi:arylsulfatase A-like enzyme